MLTEKIEAIGRAPWAALDTLARGIWIDHTAGRIGDAEAQALAEAVEARRRALRKPTQGPFMPRVVVVREGAGRASAGNVAGRKNVDGAVPVSGNLRGALPRSLCGSRQL